MEYMGIQMTYSEEIKIKSTKNIKRWWYKQHDLREELMNKSTLKFERVFFNKNMLFDNFFSIK